MVNRCSVYGCGSTGKDNRDLKFHRFPRDERCQLWIDACQRPELKDKNINQLYNMYVCSLHFEGWMYKKNKLKGAAIPILNLPSASIHSKAIQNDAPKIDIINDLHSRSIQHQAGITPVAVSVETCSKSQTTQTANRLTEHNPRKRKLRKQIISCDKRLMEDAKSSEVTREQFFQGCDKFLSPNLSKIVKAQASLNPHTKNNRNFKKFKLFCSNPYYSSPHAYKFLSKTSCMPSKRTWATLAIPIGTKISDYIWGVLSRATKRLSPSERECMFCMDEMSLKFLHEINDVQNPNAAGFAFTIVLKGILGNWKQLVGYAYITTSKIDELLEKWIISTIEQLFALGFKIRAVVSDQGSDFIKFSESRGISKGTPYFEIDGNKIYYIFDVPHLTKCVRNILMKYNFEFNGKTASWDDIYKCYKLDKQKDFRCAPKLTDAHISPNNFQKQKVRLATQVLSNSVKAAVETYAKAGDLCPHDGTVEFIDTFDKLFDLLNSSNLFSPKPYNKPYRDSELQRNLLHKVQDLLSNLKVREKDTGKDVINTMKFINAFSITINAIIQLYDDLKKESGYNEFYLLTRRLNNDSLENL